MNNNEKINAIKLNHAINEATSLSRHKPNIYLLYPVNTQEKEERDWLEDMKKKPELMHTAILLMLISRQCTKAQHKTLTIFIN